ncbi:unnamed protein product [Ascophyllum nodosum]
MAEQGQLDVDVFNFLGFWNQRGTNSVCPTTSTITSPAEMPYRAFIARLYHRIEATSCPEAERNFSALAFLIGDLRSRMLASKVERMMFIRLNKHLIDEVGELDAAVKQARARVAKSAQISVMWIVSLVCLPLFSLFSTFFLYCCCCFSHPAYWLPTRKKYFTRWPIPLVVC